MQTRSLITLVKKQANDWSRENIREVLNEVQNYLCMQKPLNYFRMKDTTTGKDPILSTTSAAYEYDIGTTELFPYDAWWVERVYKSEDDYEDGYGKSADGSDSDYSVTRIPGDDENVAKVIFNTAPNGDYYVECYRKPTQITDESIQLTVPISYHLNTVYEGVVGWIEMSTSGRSDRWTKFETVLAPKFQNLMNRGRVDEITFVTPKGY